MAADIDIPAPDSRNSEDGGGGGKVNATELIFRASLKDAKAREAVEAVAGIGAEEAVEELLSDPELIERLEN